jgi:hypothetical protein
MWNDISTALGTATSSNISAASAGNDLYECYIWALVLEAAQRQGATIRLMTRSGIPAISFHFRTSPTAIFSTLHDYCHAEVRFPRAPVLEAHIGIYVSGKSKVNHECDVAVVYQDEANTCRDNNVHPRSRQGPAFGRMQILSKQQPRRRSGALLPRPYRRYLHLRSLLRLDPEHRVGGQALLAAQEGV